MHTALQTPDKSIDQVTLVNESDEVIGTMDKIEAHRGEAQLHRCVSVYLFDKKTNSLLIQQRASVKIVGANQWANTICGNVRPTENYEECAYRRLREELGIEKTVITPIYKFVYHLRCNEEFSEWEMDQVFFGWYDGEVVLNLSETQDYACVSWDELLKKTHAAPLKESEFNTKEIEILHLEKNQPITLTPWFVWMLSDEKLVAILEKKLLNKTQ